MTPLEQLLAKASPLVLYATESIENGKLYRIDFGIQSIYGKTIDEAAVNMLKELGFEKLADEHLERRLGYGD